MLCESVLRTLDSRAEREIRKETTIDQAITTLKIALEFRKAMLENILVSMGGDSRYRKSNLLQHVPENVISATARSLLMLSRCFLHKRKVKCAQRSLRDAESLFQSKRVSL